MMTRHFRSIFVFVLFVSVTCWIGTLNREATVSLLTFGALVMSCFHRQLGKHFHLAMRVALVGALLILFFDPTVYQSQPAEAETTATAAKVTSTHDRVTGDMTVTYSADYMREAFEERKKLHDENPELWRAQLHARLALMQKAKKEREEKMKELEEKYRLPEQN